MVKCGFQIDWRTGDVQLVENEMKEWRDCSHERIDNPIEILPKDFIAIDFETANSKRCSPCSVGVAVVKGGRVVDCFERLIKPHKNYSNFDPFNVDIHGITPETVENAPCFSEAMQDILSMIDNNILVAHNMVFDCSVLYRTLDLYELPKPTCRTICTCNLSRIVFPKLLSHRLNIVSDYLGITLSHHNAASDALACAKVLLKMPDNAISLIKNARYSFCYINEEGNWSPQAPKNYCNLQKEKASTKAFDKIAKNVSCKTALFDCDFVFTGTLKSMERKVAHAIVEAAGGRASEHVSSQTEYLVMGIQDFSRFADGKKSSKTKKAEALRAEGYPIEIITEEDFLKMIDF